MSIHGMEFICEHGGQMLNEGLLFQKEGFGARAIMYDVYELRL